MTISLIVATRNRAADLRRLLGSLKGLRVPSGSALEVIVVDNGSTDGTADLLGGGKSELAPRVTLRPVSVREPGKSRALNRAMELANGEIFAFTDDDVTLDQEWFVAMKAAFDEGFEAVQGGVQLELDRPRPWWLTPRLEAICAATGLCREEHQPTELNGSNMAVRNCGQVPRFCEEIGPGTRQFVMGEDVEWSRRVLPGRRAAYRPEIKAFHHLGARLNFSEIAWRQFITAANLLVWVPPAERRQAARRALMRLPFSFCKAIYRALTLRLEVSVHHLFDVIRDLGIVCAPLRGVQAHPCWHAGRSGDKG